MIATIHAVLLKQGSTLVYPLRSILERTTSSITTFNHSLIPMPVVELARLIDPMMIESLVPLDLVMIPILESELVPIMMVVPNLPQGII